MQSSNNNQENPNPDQKPTSEIKDFHEKEAEITAADNEEDDGEEEEEQELGFEFSFMADEAKYPSSPISAEEAFANGQIKPAVQFYGRDLIAGAATDETIDLPARPPVKNVYIELSSGEGRGGTADGEREEEGGDDVYAVTSSPTPSCKKSNSTGFSRIWRFSRGFAMGRSHSDGRDAFVFLNEGHAPPCGKASAAAEGEEEGSKSSSVKIKGQKSKKKGKGRKEEEESSSSSTTVKGSKGKGKKVNNTSLSAYMRSKADEKRRTATTYLPYRPGLMGFFTNVSGGVSKNLHPF